MLSRSTNLCVTFLFPLENIKTFRVFAQKKGLCFECYNFYLIVMARPSFATVFVRIAFIRNVTKKDRCLAKYGFGVSTNLQQVLLELKVGFPNNTKHLI